jgi:iron complex outermembrane receptor protein
VIEDYHYGDWLYELGLRLDRDNIKPDSTAADQQLFNGISGSLSTVWNFHPIWTLGLALSQSERAPSVEELYSNVESTTEFVEHAATQSIEIGSNTLVQEVSRNIDLTLTRKSEISSAKVSLFHNDYRDYIFLANSGQQQHAVPIFRYSQQDARFSGLEFDYKVQLPWPSSADMSWQLFGDYIRSELQSGQDVPRMPPLRLGSRLNYTAGPLTASLAVLKASPQHRPGDNEFRTEGYTRWDAELAYRFNQGRPLQYLAFIKLNNIGDEDIRYSVSYLRDVAPEAGRSVVVGLRVAFN